MRHHGLVVIGSGSGNSFPDACFAHLDAALVEHDGGARTSRARRPRSWSSR